MKIELDVKMTVKDMYKFLMNNTYRKLTGIIWIIFSVVVVCVTIFTWEDVSLMNSVLLIVLASLYTVINPLMLYMRAKKQVNNTEGFKEPLHYDIDEKRIKVSQNTTSEKTNWDSIWKIVRYGNQVLIYVTNLRAFVIPVEAFGENYDEFAKFAAEKLGNRSKLKRA